MCQFTVAAIVFLALIGTKFLVGAICEAFDWDFQLDAMIELVLAVAIAFIVALVADICTGRWILGAAMGYFAVTLWSAISIWKTSMMMNLGVGRRQR